MLLLKKIKEMKDKIAALEEELDELNFEYTLLEVRVCDRCEGHGIEGMYEDEKICIECGGTGEV